MIASTKYNKSVFEGFDADLKRSLSIPDFYTSTTRWVESFLRGLFAIVALPLLFIALLLSLTYLYYKLRRYYIKINKITIRDANDYCFILEINTEAKKAHRLFSKLLHGIRSQDINFVKKVFIFMFDKFNGVLKSISHTTSLKLEELNPVTHLDLLTPLGYKDLNHTRTTAYSYKF